MNNVVPMTELISKRVSDEQLKEAVRQFAHCLFWDATNFTAQLFKLFLKADSVNHERLRMAFPAEALAVELWRVAPSETKFFRDFGVPV